MPPILPSPLRLRGGGHARKSHPKEQRHANNRIRKHGSSSSGAGSGANRLPGPSNRKLRSAHPDILTDLDKLAAEERAVKEEISRLGLSLRDVEGDGNCLFRALSDQLYGDQSHHPDLRRWVCDWIMEHKEEMEFWVQVCTDGEQFEAYVERMRKHGQYASEVEVNAAARMLERDIRIIHSDHSDTIPSQAPSAVSSIAASPFPEPMTPSTIAPSSPTTTTTAEPRRRTRSSTTYQTFNPLALPDRSIGHDKLWLALFNDAEHYQSIRLPHSAGASRIPDTLVLPHEKDKSEAARVERGEIPLSATATSNSAVAGETGKFAEILRALPPQHGFEKSDIENTLGRTRGNVSEAIEILLEQYSAMGAQGEEHGPASTVGEVEDMLVDSSPPVSDSDPLWHGGQTVTKVTVNGHGLESDKALHQEHHQQQPQQQPPHARHFLNPTAHRYREPSPSYTKSTTSTEPHSPSGSTTTATSDGEARSGSTSGQSEYSGQSRDSTKSKSSSLSLSLPVARHARHRRNSKPYDRERERDQDSPLSSLASGATTVKPQPRTKSASTTTSTSTARPIKPKPVPTLKSTLTSNSNSKSKSRFKSKANRPPREALSPEEKAKRRALKASKEVADLASAAKAINFFYPSFGGAGGDGQGHGHDPARRLSRGMVTAVSGQRGNQSGDGDGGAESRRKEALEALKEKRRAKGVSMGGIGDDGGEGRE